MVLINHVHINTLTNQSSEIKIFNRTYCNSSSKQRNQVTSLIKLREKLYPISISNCIIIIISCSCTKEMPKCISEPFNDWNCNITHQRSCTIHIVPWGRMPDKDYAPVSWLSAPSICSMKSWPSSDLSSALSSVQDSILLQPWCQLWAKTGSSVTGRALWHAASSLHLKWSSYLFKQVSVVGP